MLLEEELQAAQVVLPEGCVVHEVARALDPFRVYAVKHGTKSRLEVAKMLLEPRELLGDGMKGEATIAARRSGRSPPLQ